MHVVNVEGKKLSRWFLGEKRRKNNNNLCKVMSEVSKMFPAKRQTMLLLFSPH